MEPGYDSPDDRDVCERHEAAVALLGQVAATELETVIADLHAAETAAEFISLRPDRFIADGPHILVMNLRCGVRLRFVSGHPMKKGRVMNATDWTKTSRLRFVAIEVTP